MTEWVLRCIIKGVRLGRTRLLRHYTRHPEEVNPFGIGATVTQVLRAIIGPDCVAAIRYCQERSLMIDDLIHFYRRGAPPFRSLSALPDDAAVEIMHDMYVPGSAFWGRFEDPGQYRKARRAVEDWLRHGFIAKGGRPEEQYPIYMVLGMTPWLLAAGDEATLATTADIRVPLALFADGDVSFTYPDSMCSFMLAQQPRAPFYLPGYHGQVFTLDEIRAIVETAGLPGERWGTELPAHLPNYIEAQVWNPQPLLDFQRASVG